VRSFCKSIVVAAVLGAVLPAVARAQSDYPTRPVSLIIPYAAGGVADVSMRLVGGKLSDRLKQQFVIENRPGGGGVIAAQAVASAAPDGYTLLQSGNNTAISEALFNKLPFNVIKDFASVSTVEFCAFVVV
jgi:tripartite-type tricarboxylate transporter receptor subunit TctC